MIRLNLSFDILTFGLKTHKHLDFMSHAHISCFNRITGFKGDCGLNVALKYIYMTKQKRCSGTLSFQICSWRCVSFRRLLPEMWTWFSLFWWLETQHDELNDSVWVIFVINYIEDVRMSLLDVLTSFSLNYNWTLQVRLYYLWGTKVTRDSTWDEDQATRCLSIAAASGREWLHLVCEHFLLSHVDIFHRRLLTSFVLFWSSAS